MPFLHARDMLGPHEHRPRLRARRSLLQHDVEVYDNLFVNAGLEVPGCENGGGHTFLLSVGGANNRSRVLFYNNTAYGYGAGYPGLSKAGYGIEVDFGGTWEWVNNLVVDTLGVPFTSTHLHCFRFKTFPIRGSARAYRAQGGRSIAGSQGCDRLTRTIRRGKR